MQLYNVSFVTDRAIVLITEEAEDESQAHSQGLATAAEELGLNLIPINYQIEVEEVTA